MLKCREGGASLVLFPHLTTVFTSSKERRARVYLSWGSECPS